MAIRNIVKIDEEKCNGCGDCIVNCPEGALAIIDGKARVVRESFCDGLGVCIGKCPLGAISIEQREAEEFDADAVAAHIAAEAQEDKKSQPRSPSGGCPGTTARVQNVLPIVQATVGETGASAASTSSQLSHWPVQLALVAGNTPFLKEADLLLVADCVPFAMGDFHEKLLAGRVVLVGCPKLDDAQSYVEKLTSIFVHSRPSSLKIVHMEVPCCSGLCRIVKEAVDAAGHDIPVDDVTISTSGAVIATRTWG
ncbi:MAG: 4Fe-4S binding protein [Planctomycetota bacterium]|nr:4Fe-4S binding protein [Planctomycetota bacterium]